MKERTIFALGFFDGVHLGHQALLKACRELAEQQNCRAGVVTFTAHPDALVLGKAPVLLTTTEDRKRLLQLYGAEIVLQLPFDAAMQAMPWPEFLEFLIAQGAGGFVCGADFRFGHKGAGNAEILRDYCQKHGLCCAVVPEQNIDGITVSSTHIRKLLAEGRVTEANRFLGHPHCLTGTVIAGKQLGRTIGFPTANLRFPEGILIPKCGVYATKVTVDGAEFSAITNIGSRPTVNGEGVTVESHLLDFSGDLYGKEISLFFLDFLRPEEKFATLEALKAQIQKDIAQTAERAAFPCF